MMTLLVKLLYTPVYTRDSDIVQSLRTLVELHLAWETAYCSPRHMYQSKSIRAACINRPLYRNISDDFVAEQMAG